MTPGLPGRRPGFRPHSRYSVKAAGNHPGESQLANTGCPNAWPFIRSRAARGAGLPWRMRSCGPVCTDPQ